MAAVPRGPKRANRLVYIYIYIYIYLLPDYDLWISNLLMDVGVSRTKLGCTVLSAVAG